LTLSWGNGSDAETSAASLGYLVRIGTTVAGSSTTLKVPARVSLNGSSPYSTRITPAARGLKIVMQKETTAYWSVTAEDGESLRSAESAEQSAYLAAPAAIADLSAAQDNTVETSSSAWMTLTWTVPGEDGSASTLQSGAVYDLRWSTAGAVDSQAKYEAVPNQLLIAADGQVPGTLRTQLVAVPPGKTYYFALTAKDSLGSRSGLSNAAAGVFANALMEETTGIAIATALQGDTTAFLKVKLWVDSGMPSLTWLKIGVRKTGGVPDSAVKNVAVYQDSNANGIFDAADSFALRTSPAVFVSSAATLTLSPSQTINTTTKTYFVALQFEPANLQTDGSSVALRLDPQPFTVRGAGVPGTDLPALLLDGVDDRVRVPTSGSLNAIGALTVEAWVKTTDPGANRSIVTRANGGLTQGFRLWLNGAACGAGVPTLFIGPAFLCANRDGVPVRVDDGRWHHLAASYNDLATHGKRMFVDGEMLSTGPVSAGLGGSFLRR
ncbi:MAG: LamG-like jellyroll fold domain-containing protein, partial [Elusimicrobiota bacterium]